MKRGSDDRDNRERSSGAGGESGKNCQTGRVTAAATGLGGRLRGGAADGDDGEIHAQLVQAGGAAGRAGVHAGPGSGAERAAAVGVPGSEGQGWRRSTTRRLATG